MGNFTILKALIAKMFFSNKIVQSIPLVQKKMFNFDIVEVEFTKSSSGSYGHYFKLTEDTGVKIEKYASFDTPKDAWASKTMQDEGNNCRKAAELTNLVPRFHKFVVVKMGDKYHHGLVMEHVGQRICDISEQEMTWKKKGEIADDMRKKLQDAGLNHTDLHTANVTRKGDKFYAIDFGHIDFIQKAA